MKKTAEQWLALVPKEHKLKLLSHDPWESETACFETDLISKEDFDRMIRECTLSMAHEYLPLYSSNQDIWK